LVRTAQHAALIVIRPARFFIIRLQLKPSVLLFRETTQDADQPISFVNGAGASILRYLSRIEVIAATLSHHRRSSCGVCGQA
jgi:hypothetical protein